uniref:Formin_GBD_N domain-containing protein n=2 Tax=Caenorhabditis japonica TaxID=281687 RepID=K7HV27_CAEJA
MDDDDTFTCRIQYINDADPFATTSSSYLEPMRPVTFKFRLHECISDQLQDVIRTLRAPHKAGDSSLQVYRGLEGGGGELHTYLDNEMTLSDQQDELDILKADTIYQNFICISVTVFIQFSNYFIINRGRRRRRKRLGLLSLSFLYPPAGKLRPL